MKKFGWDFSRRHFRRCTKLFSPSAISFMDVSALTSVSYPRQLCSHSFTLSVMLLRFLQGPIGSLFWLTRTLGNMFEFRNRSLCGMYPCSTKKSGLVARLRSPVQVQQTWSNLEWLPQASYPCDRLVCAPWEGLPARDALGCKENSWLD